MSAAEKTIPQPLPPLSTLPETLTRATIGTAALPAILYRSLVCAQEEARHHFVPGRDRLAARTFTLAAGLVFAPTRAARDFATQATIALTPRRETPTQLRALFDAHAARAQFGFRPDLDDPSILADFRSFAEEAALVWDDIRTQGQSGFLKMTRDGRNVTRSFGLLTSPP